MKRFIGFLFLSSLAAATAATATLPAKPNLIVIYTDDHGHADLGLHGAVDDIKTPNLDALARGGVLAKHGYSTAPQCVPSRAGLLTGRFQGRFNLDSNGGSLAGFNQQTTIATRLQQTGYQTAQFGKWHLGAAAEIPRHGFKHVFSQAIQRPFAANITIDGKDRPMGSLAPEMYHIDACSRAAAAVITRYRNEPFFLYIAYRAPHTPLDAPKSYTDRFPGKMPERRRQALGMISAIDDGVGRITATLKQHGLTERTLIFFIGDNGAPLKIHKTDSPLKGDPGGWDGSLNTPLNGEKGMLAEGGIHVPFVVSWPGTIPAGQTYPHPVSALDVAATAAAIAGIEVKPGELDGVNLLPHLKGEKTAAPHEALYWRWVAQSAIREGDWKLLRGGDREYLFNLSADLGEKRNLAAKHPEIATRLRGKLTAWANQLDPPGLALAPMAKAWTAYFDHYLDGKTLPRGDGGEPDGEKAVTGWQARNGSVTEKDGILRLTPASGAKDGSAFLTRTGLKLAGPVTARITLRGSAAGAAAVAWRTKEENDFLPAHRAGFTVTASDGWQTHEVPLPASGTIVHLRLHFPGGRVELREVEFESRAK
jgi:arylsulfatase A-like enzyme